MRLSFRIAAGPDTHFAPNAFASQIGKNIPLNVGPHRLQATVIEGQVADGGNSMLVTLQIADGQDAAALTEVIKGETPATFAGYRVISEEWSKGEG